MHLLQLVGAQVWPNFLSILAFKPNKVTFLTSLDTEGQFARSVANLAVASKEAGHSFEYHIIKTESREPSIAECSRAVADLSVDLINITGGTKPMSIAAHIYATTTSTPSFYLDTRRQEGAFEFTSSGKSSPPHPSLIELSSKICVRIALMAQGFPVPSSFKTPEPNQTAFSKRASNIRADRVANQAVAVEIASLRSQFIDSKRGRLLRKGNLRAALQIPFGGEAEGPFHDYLIAAAENDIIEQLQPQSEFLLTKLDPTTEGADTLRSVADGNFKLLEGIWFEIALLDHLRDCSGFSDVCWSVEADSENSDSIGETDIVAFNSTTLSLHFISCKIAGPHGNSLDHIQGLRRRATKEGGKFSKAELWIHSPRSPQSRASLEKHCREQGVRFRVFTEEVASY